MAQQVRAGTSPVTPESWRFAGMPSAPVAAFIQDERVQVGAGGVNPAVEPAGHANNHHRKCFVVF